MEYTRSADDIGDMTDQHVAEKLATVSTLSSGVTHEINNYMNVMSMRVELALADGTDAATIKKMLQGVQSDIERIIKSMVTLSAIMKEYGKDVAFSAGDVLRDSIKEVSSKGELDGVKVIEKMDSGLGQIMGDREVMMRGFINIIQNSAQAMVKGGTLTAQAKEDTGGEAVRIEIQDSGKGIAPHQMDRIFKPFFSSKEGHLGLGLYDTHRVLEYHGGSIKIESVKDRGTTVVMHLPIKDRSK